MKVSELRGAQLDLWVARARGYPDSYVSMDECIIFCRPDHLFQPRCYEPSQEWSEGGPVIHQYGISTLLIDSPEKEWCGAFMLHKNWTARTPDGLEANGATPLVAAMRVFIALVFGEEVHESDAIKRKSDNKVMKEMHIRLGSSNKGASKPSDEMA